MGRWRGGKVRRSVSPVTTSFILHPDASLLHGLSEPCYRLLLPPPPAIISWWWAYVLTRRLMYASPYCSGWRGGSQASGENLTASTAGRTRLRLNDAQILLLYLLTKVKWLLQGIAVVCLAWMNNPVCSHNLHTVRRERKDLILLLIRLLISEVTSALNSGPQASKKTKT